MTRTVERMRTGWPSRPDDPEYVALLAAEEKFWSSTPLDIRVLDGLVPAPLRAYYDERHTGRADVRWFEDLMGRGDFPSAAILGATSGYYEGPWLRGNPTGILHVHDVSAPVLRRTRARLPPELRGRLRPHRVDLNFASFGHASYDVVLAVSCLHHVLRLEALFEHVRRALKPGGLFAFYEYVGEPRLQFTEARWRLVDSALREVPPLPRRSPPVPLGNLPPENYSPFEAVRSDEIGPLAREYFEEIHFGDAAILAPLLLFHVDLPRLARSPELIDRLIGHERDAAARGFAGCTAYGVYRA